MDYYSGLIYMYIPAVIDTSTGTSTGDAVCDNMGDGDGLYFPPVLIEEQQKMTTLPLP